MTFQQVFPSFEVAMMLEPEELAPFLLKYLSFQHSLNRYNFTLGTNPDLMTYAGSDLMVFCERLMEAWVWLEKELMIAPKPGQQGEWVFITRKGQKMLEEQNFETYVKESVLMAKHLDAVLARKAYPLYIRGDYDTAIFQAFKEVEVRVRKLGGMNDAELGVKMMRKAFSPNDGILTDKLTESGEQQGMMDIFAGAIGLYKNPSSHRNVEYADPEEVADIIRIANQLLRILERIK